MIWDKGIPRCCTGTRKWMGRLAIDGICNPAEGLFEKRWSSSGRSEETYRFPRSDTSEKNAGLSSICAPISNDQLWPVTASHDFGTRRLPFLGESRPAVRDPDRTLCPAGIDDCIEVIRPYRPSSRSSFRRSRSLGFTCTLGHLRILARASVASDYVYSPTRTTERNTASNQNGRTVNRPTSAVTARMSWSCHTAPVGSVTAAAGVSSSSPRIGAATIDV
jgi:hypothetical protein